MNKLLLIGFIILAPIVLIFAVLKANDVTIKENFGGTYTISGSGSKLNPLVVDGNGFTARCVKVTGNYVTVRNFIVEDCDSHAILVLGNNVVVENNTVRHSVTENGTEECGITDNFWGWGSAIKAERGSHDVTIRGNKVYENCGEGIASTMSYNVLIENNTVWDNFSVNIYVDNSYYVKVIKNTVFCTGIYLRNGRRPAGIVLAEETYEGWGTQRHDNSVTFNKISECHVGISSWESEEPDGREIRLLIEGNRVFNTVGLSIELNTINEDVIVRSNLTDKPVYSILPEGVEVTENIHATATPSAP